MAVSDKNISQIEQYIDGTMTVREREQFEQLVSESAEVKAALEKHRLMVQSLRKAERKQLRTDLKTMLKESTGKGGVMPLNIGRRRLYWVAAAAVFLLGSFFVYNLFFTQSPSSEDLFKEYYTAFPVVQTRDAEDSTGQVLRLYSAKEYAEALPYLEALTSSEKAPNQYRLLLSSCYLSLEQPANALIVLKPLQSQNTLLKNHARWYTMLAHLKLGELAEVRTLLTEIVSSGDDYSERAESLLEQLPR